MLLIASDHAGFELKQVITQFLKDNNQEFIDLGCNNTNAVDYPDYAYKLALKITDKAILICGSGIGMSIAANRFSHIRAALCNDPEMAKLAREHNDANVLVLGARIIDQNTALKCLKVFLNTEFKAGHHQIRVDKLKENIQMNKFFSNNLNDTDNDIKQSIDKELHRQQNQIELIASENIVSKAVLEAQGSILTNKYAEGYPGRRYYGGCEFVDEIESLAIERAKKLFNCNFANVQPHSGSQANQAVMLALVKPGDKILGMSLAAGGHLTHGAAPNMSGKWFEAIQYGVGREDSLIDFDQVRSLALEHKPKIIIAGGSAYPRVIDFAKFRAIADEVGAYFWVDMAHFAGLVAVGEHDNPLNYADVVTTTTHKTLRGSRGGMVLTNDESISKKINSALFPGLQGGPLLHAIAGKAVAFKEALSDEYKTYIKDVIKNAKIMGEVILERGFGVVTGGTDTHLLLIDLSPKNITGNIAEKNLEEAGLTCNKNSIPFDKEKPMVTSGIRVGSPAGTTRGFKEKEFKLIGNLIADVLDAIALNNEDNLRQVVKNTAAQVAKLCKEFPIYT